MYERNVSQSNKPSLCEEGAVLVSLFPFQLYIIKDYKHTFEKEE